MPSTHNKLESLIGDPNVLENKRTLQKTISQTREWIGKIKESGKNYKEEDLDNTFISLQRAINANEGHISNKNANDIMSLLREVKMSVPITLRLAFYIGQIVTRIHESRRKVEDITAENSDKIASM